MNMVLIIFTLAAIIVLLSLALCTWMIAKNKSHRLWWIISVVLLVLGIACFILASVIGVCVDDKSILHEPFALIPIGYFLSLTGVLSVLLRMLLNRLKATA